MELDRQFIEKRDFPISRRGYDPAAVDAHLRALASAVEELRQAIAEREGGRASDSLAATAGSQVQAIVAAAEVAAAEIERDAKASAEQTLADARADAERTRSDAIAQSQKHVTAVGRATAALLARVESLDGEAGALVDSLRAGATRLAGDLAAVETNMGELYDAAAGRADADAGADQAPGAVSAVTAERSEPHVPPMPPDVPSPPIAEPFTTTTSTAAVAQNQTGASLASPSPAVPEPFKPFVGESSTAAAPAAEANGEAESARLVALNMALNGDSREQTDRYIAENYEVEDRAKLLDEVYAAIES